MVLNSYLYENYVRLNKSSELFRFWVEEEEIPVLVRSWIHEFKKLWGKNSSVTRFLQRNKTWLDAETKLIQDPDEPPQKRRCFLDLEDKTKNDHARELSHEVDCIEELLMAAEKLAIHGNSPYMAKILKGLLTGGEDFAKSLLKPPRKVATVESSLLLKNELCLSKRVYGKISAFIKNELDGNSLPPWLDIIDYRNELIPKFEAPNRDQGYLSIKVSLREMVINTVQRTLDVYPQVASQLAESCSDGSVKITMRVTAGADSATGFSQYNQPGVLNEDSSLMAESFMLLSLEFETGTEIWRNPCPQSNCSVRPLSLSWTKETTELSRSLYCKFFEEVDRLNEEPLMFNFENMKVYILIDAVYTLIDGKVSNAVVGNRNTHKCPTCFSRNYAVGQSYMHSTINIGEYVIKHRAQQIAGGGALTSPQVVKEKKRLSIQLEKAFNVRVNRPHPNGGGNCNTAKLFKKLFSDPAKFAECLEMEDGEQLFTCFRLLGSLSCSSKRLNSDMVNELYQKTILLFQESFPEVTSLPPCIEKYSHLGHVADRMPLPMAFYIEEGGESSHRRNKENRLYSARKTSSEANLIDMLVSALSWSDPSVAVRMQSTQRSRKNHNDIEFSKELEKYYSMPSLEIGNPKNLDSDSEQSDDEY